MVQVENKQITISMDGDTEDLRALQISLIYLIKGYAIENLGTWGGEPFCSALTLLEATLPTFEQMRDGLNPKPQI